MDFFNKLKSQIIGRVGEKLQNVTSDFFELNLSKNHSPMQWRHNEYSSIIQWVGMFPQEKVFKEKNEWRLLANELLLLPGMTETGRLGFALQQKFRQVQSFVRQSLDAAMPRYVIAKVYLC
ncbi:hypothetical protein JY462_06850 [Serratia marcescens]|nr:hypothetical protein [Serratia marcescens]